MAFGIYDDHMPIYSPFGLHHQLTPITTKKKSTHKVHKDPCTSSDMDYVRMSGDKERYIVHEHDLPSSR